MMYVKSIFKTYLASAPLAFMRPPNLSKFEQPVRTKGLISSGSQWYFSRVINLGFAALEKTYSLSEKTRPLR